MDEVIEDSASSEEGEEEDEQLDPNNQDHEFLLLEKKFQKTISNIEQVPEAAPFIDDFNKLFETLYVYNEKQKDMQKQCDELKSNIEEKDAQLELSESLVQKGNITIEGLQKQIKAAWKMADGAHSREQTAQEIIDNLRKQINSLSAELDMKNRMNQDTSGDMGQVKTQEGLQRERDKLIVEVVQLTQKLNNALSYQEELERRNSAADVRINEFETQIEEHNMEVDRARKQIEQLENEINDLEDVVQKRDAEIAEVNDHLFVFQKQTAKLEDLVKQLRETGEKYQKENESITSKLSKLQDDYDKSVAAGEETKGELVKTQQYLRVATDDNGKLRTELKKLERGNELLEKKLQLLSQDKNTIVQDREKLRQAVANMERAVDVAKKHSDADKRALDTLTREKEILNKTILRQQALGKDHLKLIKIQEQSKKKLEREIDDTRFEINKQKKQISGLEKDRDRLAEEGLDLTTKIENLLDEIKLKKIEVFELKKTQAEDVNKLRMQQNLFEAVRAERNNLQKNLQEAGAEVCELKTKLKVSSHQSEQLKEDIAMKELLLIKEENILRKVTKEKENLRLEVNSGLEQIKNLKEEIVEMLAEERRLHKVIMNGDRLIRQQTKDLETLMNQRDILGSQLVRRNDELSLLYEKIRILQSTLHRGEAQYDQRLEDIRLLKVEIRRLRQEKKLLSKSISSITDMRQEVFHLERDLTKERLKCRALEEELQNPLNIHRWRKLEGSDPDALDLLQKVTLLQKRILRQSSEAIERERRLKEVEKLYQGLKQVVMKQPSPEIRTELTKTQRALTINTNKMKCLVSELNMSELQANEYKHNLEKMNEEFNQLRKAYLAEKRLNQKLGFGVSGSKLAVQQTNASQQQVIKYAGGGYKMSPMTPETAQSGASDVIM